MRPTTQTLTLALCALTLTLMGGCPKPETPPPGPGETPDVPAKDLPEYYRFPLDKTIRDLDPAKITDTVSATIANQLFDTLVKIAPDGTLAPSLCTAVPTPDPTGTIFTFTLHPNVKFHNGRAMTAEDVAYSLDRLLDPNVASPRSIWVDAIAGAKARLDGSAPTTSGIVVKDPATLEITLDRPNALFLWYLSQSNCGIVPKEEVDKGDDSWVQHPVGTGPFMMGDKPYNPAEGVTLEANPNYFGGAPSIKGIEYIIELEDKKRFEGFKAGYYEHTDIPPLELEAVLADPVLKAQLVERPTFDLYHIAFNCEKPPFKDNPTLRRALNYAIDKEHIVKTVLKDTWVVCQSYMPVGFPGYTAPHDGYAYNEQMARDLLAEAGYPEGAGLPTIELWVDTKETGKAVMEAVQGDLSKLGIKSEMRTLEWASFLTAMDEGQFMMGQQTWLMDYPDPDNIMFVLLDSKNWGAAGNWSRYGNPAFDALVEQAQVEPDPAKRTALYVEAEQMLYADAPWALLFNRKCQILKQPYVQGLQLTTLDRAPVIPGVELENVRFE